MSFFESFFEMAYTTGETAVCCPFPHKTPSGMEYFETNPSAHINFEKNVFHCKVCDKGYNEQQLIQKLLECSYPDSEKFAAAFDTDENYYDWTHEAKLRPEDKALALSMGISEEVIEELQIKSNPFKEQSLLFPVFMYDAMLDTRTYTPGAKYKVMSRTDAMSGLIIPYDIWRRSPKTRTTLICAGEKDMAVARSHNFNAITITGGENAIPANLEEFHGRKIAIAYDNDSAGRNGARKLANHLLSQGIEDVKIVTNFHEVCKELKEDITDFFMKYEKTRDDLIEYLKDTPWASYEEPTKEYHAVEVPNLLTASDPKYLNRIIKSNIQVVATDDATFTAPSHVILKKLKIAGSNDMMKVGAVREWKLTQENMQEVLYVIDNNMKETTIKENIRDLAKVMKTEKYVQEKVLETATVFKVNVTDMFETQSTEDIRPMEFTAYSIGQPLYSGKKYTITYKLTEHPYKGRQLVMIILAAEEANDSVSNFHVTPEIQEHLKLFQDIPGEASEKIDYIVERAKGLLGYNGDNTLISTIDLAFHTPLMFNFGAFQNERAYLDTFIVGESRVGKSSTADTLRRTYELGVFTSLAGNSATIPGLIGGSNKVNGSFQTRAGIIPQNHRGLIIFEEFGKSKQNITSELTDIRSSNEVRITRVSGTLTLPAFVRMLTLTNVKNTGGIIRPISSYPNGIEIITELVDTAEDIARYDILLVMPNLVAKNHIDPLWQPEKPFPKEALQARIRWVWSRTPEQIVMSDEVQRQIIGMANLLNDHYDCHLKLFGTEAWKKVARLAIAVAGYCVSTDDTYENIVVTEEHVNYAVNYFTHIYDNNTFRLNEYVHQERQYREIDEDGIESLKEKIQMQPALMQHLEQHATTTKQTLEACTGMAPQELNGVLKDLIRKCFIRFEGNQILPTERFRKGMTEINPRQSPIRLGNAF